MVVPTTHLGKASHRVVSQSRYTAKLATRRRLHEVSRVEETDLEITCTSLFLRLLLEVLRQVKGCNVSLCMCRRGGRQILKSPVARCT